MKVLFENSFGKRREIGSCTSKEKAYAIIKNFLDKHKFKSYYIREWKTFDGLTCIDVGSHSEFFYLQEDDV